MEGNAVHIQLLSEEKVKQLLQSSADSPSSLFLALDGWMEVIDPLPPPPPPKSPNGFASTEFRSKPGTKASSASWGFHWKHHRSRSPHFWKGSSCLWPCVKILTSTLCKFPVEIPLSVGDLLITVKVAEADDPPSLSSSDASSASCEGEEPEFAGAGAIDKPGPGTGDESSFLALGSIQKRARARRRTRSCRRARFHRSISASTHPETGNESGFASTWPIDFGMSQSPSFKKYSSPAAWPLANGPGQRYPFHKKCGLKSPALIFQKNKISSSSPLPCSLLRLGVSLPP